MERFGVKWCPQKFEPLCTRLIVGRNLIDFPRNIGTLTADMATAKILTNSMIYTPGARFTTVNLKNFFLYTPMDRFEYMKTPFDILPPEIIAQSSLHQIKHNGFIYFEIQKFMYGLPQASMIANEPPGTTSETQIQPNTDHARPMEAWVLSNHIFPRCIQRYNQNHR